MKPFARWIPPDYHPRVTGTISVPFDGSKKLLLKVNPTSYLGKVLFFRGVEGYEWHSVKIFLEMARQSRNFLDVGANIGYYSCIAAIVNPDLRVVSFEPLPSAYKYLQDNIALNGCENIEPILLALSDKVETRSFFVSHDPTFAELDDHLTTTGGFNEELSSRTNMTRELNVETDRADQYWERRYGSEERIDLIKLDTEASEHLVLEGACGILADHQPIIFCEVLPDQIGEQIETILRRNNYRMFSIRKEGLFPVNSLEDAVIEHKEYIFAHSSQVDRVERFMA